MIPIRGVVRHQTDRFDALYGYFAGLKGIEKGRSWPLINAPAFVI
jgi:hypothetical protein